MKLLFCMYAGIHRKQFCMALNSYKFYTTGIMTTAENCVILGYRKKISGGRELHRKEKDMTTMYRFDQLHSERKSLALLKDHEWGVDYMRSFKARHKRENCVFDTAPEPEA